MSTDSPSRAAPAPAFFNARLTTWKAAGSNPKLSSGKPPEQRVTDLGRIICTADQLHINEIGAVARLISQFDCLFNPKQIYEQGETKAAA
ncbi:hypothetical protein DL765_011370 [Monosporascus sp. GIB2]|nr:hypothetical protein DL765_011370 [Monosporascus sp. GIB2]